jgi:hypothetical protein
MPDNNTIVITFESKDNGAVATIKDLKGNIIQIPGAMKIAEDAIKKSTEKMKGCFSLTTIASGTLLQGVAQLKSFLSSSFQKASQFEGLQMSLEVLMGSAEEAKKKFKELADFTKGTSFEIGQVVQASNELQSLGKYSQEAMKMLSTLAMGTGKSLEQVTNAY